MAKGKTVVAFDLYGTLLSTESISTELEKLYGDKAKGIAAEARRLQLEYTWRSNSMGTYLPFNELTLFSFRHACVDIGIALSKENEERIMAAYNGLASFPDADRALAAVSSNQSQLDAWVFSNGTRAMVASSLATSPTLSRPATAAGILGPAGKEKIVSVDDEANVYKPDPRTYRHMVEVSGAAAAGDVWLVSSNPFDALGAVAAGMKSAWVDRKGSGWVDGLAGALGKRPTAVVGGVDEAIEEILRRSSAAE